MRTGITLRLHRDRGHKTGSGFVIDRRAKQNRCGISSKPSVVRARLVRARRRRCKELARKFLLCNYLFKFGKSMRKMNSRKMPSSAAEGISVRPSLREIEALRAMVATGKTTQAARDLGTSQPSVSRAIASLEARLGQPLFMRRNGRLAPTAEALAFEARAAVIFDLLDQLAAPRAGIDAVTAIRFATPPTLANLFLAPLLARFIASEPRVRVQVEIGKSTDCLAAVAEGSADLGLVDQMPSHDGVRLEVFRRARPHALLPKRHRLASRPELAISDLVGERIHALSRRFSLRTKLDAAFAAQRAEPLIVAE